MTPHVTTHQIEDMLVEFAASDPDCMSLAEGYARMWQYYLNFACVSSFKTLHRNRGPRPETLDCYPEYD